MLGENMNAFGAERKDTSIVSSGSQTVALFLPRKTKNGLNLADRSSPERQAFKNALYATLEGKVEGALSPYLFFDPPQLTEDSSVDYKADWGSKDHVLYGASGWDAHIAESTNSGDHTKTNSYDFADGDTGVIRTALQEGLVSLLPRRSTYYAYGPGEYTAISGKDFVLLDGMIENGLPLPEALNAVDINDRYARIFAQAANEKYNTASSAVQGDFMEGTLNLGQKVGTSIIGIFGGPIANAQRDEAFTPKQNASRYLAKLVSQHGEGTRVLQTIQTEANTNILLAEYKPTRRFEAFILGAFPRAVHQGIIKTPYDVFRNWKLSTEFDRAERVIKLIAAAKRTHDIEMEDRTFKISKGDGPVITLSHKWNEQDWLEICDPAGLNDIKFFGSPSRKLMYTKAVREPKPELLL